MTGAGVGSDVARISAERVGKWFGEVIAVNNCTLSVGTGVVGLLGFEDIVRLHLFADKVLRLGLKLLLVAVPFILSRERNIKASATLCVLMVGVFLAFIYLCRYMGLDPLLAAWLPVFLFGPVAIIMLDAIKT